MVRVGGVGPIVVVLFANGMGSMLSIVPSNTYMLDLSGPRGSDTVSTQVQLIMFWPEKSR